MLHSFKKYNNAIWNLTTKPYEVSKFSNRLKQKYNSLYRFLPGKGVQWQLNIKIAKKEYKILVVLDKNLPRRVLKSSGAYQEC